MKRIFKKCNYNLLYIHSTTVTITLPGFLYYVYNM